MYISISPETAKLVQQKIDTGAYRSAEDVLLAALAALDKQSLESLDQPALDAIDRAEDQLERGHVHDWKDVRAQVRAGFFGKRL